MAFFYKVNTDINGGDDPNPPQGAGYSVGGYNASGTIVNSISAVDYKTESCYTPSVYLTNNRSNLTGLSSPNVGLVCGGYDSVNSSYVNDIDGIQFSSETSIPISSVLGSSISGAGPLNGPTVGYLWSGGYGSGIPTVSQSTTGVNFSTYSSGVYTTRVAVARSYSAGVSSDTVGYGLGGGVSTEIDGLTFSTITSLNPAATLPSARHAGTGVDNTISGYHMGGSNSSAETGGQNSIYGFEIAGAYTFSVSATLLVRRAFGTAANSTSAGFIMGGTFIDGSRLNTIEKFSFLTQSIKLLNYAIMSSAHSIGAGVWTRQFHNMYGRSYLAGGNSTSGYLSSIECIEYTSTPTCRTTGVSLTVARGGVRGISSAKTGFFCGGASGGSGLSTIDGIHFSTEMQKTTSAVLATGRNAPSTFESYARGYIYAGRYATQIATIDTFIFETETRQTISASAGQAMYYGAGFSARGDTYGWSLGGASSSGTPFAAIYGLNLASETSSVSTGSLSAATYSGTAVGSHSYANAYFTGGWNGSASVAGIFSFNHQSTSGSVTVSNTGYALTTPRYDAAGSSSNTEGFISGGFNGSTRFSNIEKITLSSAVQSVTGMYLSTGRTDMGSVGAITLHQNYNLAGFVFGGWLDASNTTSTQEECYDFASEALYSIGTMVTSKANQAAASSVTTGYLGGGDLTTTTVTNTIDKFVYSTKTYTAAMSTLSLGTRANADGVNSSVKGYFCGGRNATNSAVYARIEGVIFADESYYSPGISLVNSRFGGTGNNSATVGYLMGGAVDTLATRTRSCETLTFSTEARANTANVLPSARANLAGTNSSTTAYYMGGDSAPSTAYTTCYKMTFPTLSTVTMTDALDTAKRGAKGLGNEIAGYAMGGANAGLTVSYNTIDKCTYATETIDRRDAVLTVARSRAAAVSAI